MVKIQQGALDICETPACFLSVPTSPTNDSNSPVRSRQCASGRTEALTGFWPEVRLAHNLFEYTKLSYVPVPRRPRQLFKRSTEEVPDVRFDDILRRPR